MLPAPGLPGACARASLADLDRGRILGLELALDRLAVRREDVGLPVVERQLRGRADLGLGAPGVAHVREADRDLVAARRLDLRLGDAQLVDAVAHDVDRSLERVLGHRLRLRAREALVDELDAALEVEAENRLLGLDRAGDPGDHDQGANQQPEDDEQDEAISLAISHRSWWMLERRRRRRGRSGHHRWLVGVSTTSTPPSSSSYAGKMSATALAGKSRSAWTSTGLALTRTSHSSAVST